MTFIPVDTRVPSAIQAITVQMQKYIDDFGSTVKTVTYKVVIVDQAGVEMVHQHDHGNLLLHLSDEDKTWLNDFAERMWTKAESEFLP